MTKANFVDLKDHFSRLNHTYLDDPNLTIDQKWDIWYEYIMSVINPLATNGEYTSHFKNKI